MKITIKAVKPRNPLVAPTKTRKAGAHKSDHPDRRSRNEAKHSLHLLLAGRKVEGNFDA